MKKWLICFILTLPVMVFAQNTDTCKVTIPNALTRNVENIKWENKLQVFHDCAVKEFKMTVYDRWGEALLKDAKLQEDSYVDWNFEKLAGGVYVWMITCKQLQDGKWTDRKFMGSITLIN